MWERLRNISKKFFFSKFRVKIECNWSYGSNEPRIFKFLGFWWKWGITHSKEALFSVWNKSMRVWPWEVTKIEAFLRHWLSLWGIGKFWIGYPVIWYQLCFVTMGLWEIMTSSNVRAGRKGGVLTQILPPLLLFPPEDMAGQVLFNVWMRVLFKIVWRQKIDMMEKFCC